MLDLRYILRRAWRITGRHRALWLFGFLISLGAMGTRVGLGGRGVWQQVAQELAPGSRAAIQRWFASPYFLAAVALLTLLVGAALTVLSAVGRGALVSQVWRVEDRDHVALRAGWETGRAHWIPVLLIRLVLSLPVTLLTFLGLAPALLTQLVARLAQESAQWHGLALLLTPLTFLGCTLPAAGVSVLLAGPLSVWQRLAVRTHLFEGHGVRASVKHSWTRLRENLGPLALLWLILLGLQVVVLSALMLVLLQLGVGILLAALVGALVDPLAFFALLLGGWGLVWLLATGAGSVVETFVSAAWTLAYREITGLGLTGQVPGGDREPLDSL
jgi:hypothetical protein